MKLIRGLQLFSEISPKLKRALCVFYKILFFPRFAQRPNDLIHQILKIYMRDNQDHTEAASRESAVDYIYILLNLYLSIIETEDNINTIFWQDIFNIL